MKKFISLILAFCVLMSLCACSSSSDDATEALEIGQDGYKGSSDEEAGNYDPAMQAREDDFASLLDAIPYSEIALYCNSSSFSVEILIQGLGNITYFGNYIIEAKSAYESFFDESQRGSLSIFLKDGDEYVVTYFDHDFALGEAGKYGLILDDRSGDSVYTPLDSVDDLYKMFPAAAINAESSETFPAREGIEMTIDFYFGTRTGTYSGDLNEDGLPDGYGTFTSINQEGESWTYEGDWVDGHWNGTGTSTWESGQMYSGEFVDDYESGFGIRTYVTGDRFEGTFNNGVARGEGILYFTDGTFFEGTFESLNEAIGTYIFDGTQYQAVLENGEVTYYPNTGVSIEPSTEATTGAITEPTTEPTAQPTDATVNIESQTSAYILNTNSRKFHKPSCASAKKISASNRSEFSGTREEIIAKGYEPCKNCNP